MLVPFRQEHWTTFLSSNAQDFIEDVMWVMVYPLRP